MNNKVSIFVAVILSVVVTSIFFIVLESNDSDNEITPFESNETKISNSEFSPSSEIKKINSEMELKEIISTSSNNQNFFVEPRMIRTAIFEESMVMDSVQSLPTPSAMTENSKIQGTEYSTTNNQVTGVDEPDFIKNDSKYIYIVSGNTITIIDGYPGESAKVILKTAIDVEYQYIENMFLNNNRLVIFYNDQSNEEIIPEFDFMPRPTYQPITHVMIIDISDKQNLKILKDYSIDGNFSQARMIGDNVYFVTNSYIDYQFPRFPVIFENSKKIMNPDAFYFENSEEMTNFNTITALNIIDYTINSETFLSGYSGTFYVSEKNFYITYQQNIPYRFYQDLAKEKFFEVILPFFSNEIQAQINVIYENDKTDSEKWAEISEIIESQYDKMNKQEKEELFKKIDKLIECVGNTTNITNNIVLNCYGSEDLSHITDTFKTNLLKLPYQMIPKLIEEIHFNQQKPENKNIYLPNKKQPFIKIYRNCKWEYKDRKETIKDLINTNYHRLEDHYQCKGKTELNNCQNNRYIDFVDKWGEHSELENEIEKKCEILILNSGKKQITN